MKNTILLATLLCVMGLNSQEVDTTSITKNEYPYVLPILGKKAYEKGYTLPLPFSASIGTIFNKQGIILENFRMAFTQGDEIPDFERLDPISELIQFGPSQGRINTLFGRIEAWVLPFISVGGYYGKVWGKQTITLLEPIAIESNTDINGQYYGINLVGVIPVGPVILQGDYSWSWTTNERLDKPVKVRVSGMRVMKRFVSKTNPSKFWAVWAGAQYQNLEGTTSGKIGLGEALDLTPEDIEEFDQQWEEYTMSPEWDALSLAEKTKATTAYNIIRNAATNLEDTTVYYQFDKRLEFEWNMVIGGTYVFNKHWAIRGEYGLLKSKQSLMFQVAYNFGL
ncbi:hypothetical protein [Winogradskyella aurantiaca]|uniref:hypothetical protein n=1 Tax=Winogradskyella aurantiaca TaxID=2219558 RepID=UPI000E1DD445|nr:hypothetical protein [Winogradskyella aurantiaca]